MTNDASSAGVSASSPADVTLPFKGVVAVVIGNWLEFYDFLVFTFFAVMIGDAFFRLYQTHGPNTLGLLDRSHDTILIQS